MVRMEQTLPHLPAPESSRNTPYPLARAFRTSVAVLAGIALGTAHADLPDAGIAQWHDIIYLLAPAIAALLEALADRLAGRRRQRKGH